MMYRNRKLQLLQSIIRKKYGSKNSRNRKDFLNLLTIDFSIVNIFNHKTLK